jgi:hypothetical protein
VRGSTQHAQNLQTKETTMYAEQQFAVGQFTAGDQLALSRRAAERHSQLSAAIAARRQRANERREARLRRRRTSVAVA